MELKELGKAAAAVKYELACMPEEEKNHALLAVAEGLIRDEKKILAANAEDVADGEAKGMHPGLVDRLRLTGDRICAMAEGLRQVSALPDPVGEILDSFLRPNGLKIEKRRVPLGVIGIIYESRPNVTADAFGLCFKAGNACILKEEATLFLPIWRLRRASGLLWRNAESIRMRFLCITDTNRAVTEQFMRMNEYVDVLIPRGGAGLIRAVWSTARYPSSKRDGKLSHYVDEYADLAKPFPSF